MHIATHLNSVLALQSMAAMFRGVLQIASEVETEKQQAVMFVSWQITTPF